MRRIACAAVVLAAAFSASPALADYTIPAGSTATLSNVSMGACNSLTYGYQLDGGAEQGQTTFPGGCGRDYYGNVTIGPFATAHTLRIDLRDNNCGYSFDSNGPHAAGSYSSGGGVYYVGIADGGGYCEHPPYLTEYGDNLSLYVTVNAPSDTTAPTTTDDAPSGWQNHTVTVHLTATDNPGGSGVKTTYYTVDGGAQQTGTTVTIPAPVDGSDDGVHTISYLSVDNAGNTESAHTATVKIDTIPPTVAYSGNAGTYTVADSIDITCSASDALSGIDPTATNCQDIVGPGYTFALGTNGFSASATDQAGNAASASTSFQVTVSTASLATLTQRFVTDSGIAHSLVVKLNAAQASIDRGNQTSKAGQLAAFRNELTAQTGETVTAEDAAILSRLSEAL